MEISKYDLSCTRYYIVMVIYTTQLLKDLVILINLKLIMYKLKKFRSYHYNFDMELLYIRGSLKNQNS